MLSCPLATSFDARWLVCDEPPKKRVALGVGLSVALHLLVAGAIGFYELHSTAPLVKNLRTAGVMLPIRARLVTVQELAAALPRQSVAVRQTDIPRTSVLPSKLTLPVQTQDQRALLASKAKRPSQTAQQRKAMLPGQGAAEKSSVAGTQQASLAEGVHSSVQLSQLQFRRSPQIPDYPALARRRAQQGTVVLLLTVETTGDISQVRVAHSSGFPLLDNAAQQAALQWQLFPFTQAGVPVSRRIQVPYEFTLTEKRIRP